MLNRAYAPTPKESKILGALRDWGCPVHWHILRELTGYDYYDLSPALSRLAQRNVIRRVAPGAYSYYGEERD